jgi:selenide, water dikinase
MPPEALAQVLRQLGNLFPPEQYPALQVGLGAADDAAVYRLTDELALIQTIDFFTPIVDTPYEFGAIAAANALSDIYAMGGEVIFALNIAAFPPELPPEILAEVLRGGADVLRSVGAPIAGGHTIRDKEPKYGLAVSGLVNPAQMFIKGGARPGDLLVLTKPLGTGTITTALKREQAQPEHVQAAIESMMRLNRTAAQAAKAAEVRGATDVTGFGLIGHALEMAGAARAGFRMRFDALPWLPGALEYAREWVFAGGAHDNLAFYNPLVTYARELPDWQRTLLNDPQTSGGLLIALPRSGQSVFADFCRAHDQPFWTIGEVVEGSAIVID